MPRQIETSPHYISPDYWAVDIGDTEAFDNIPGREWVATSRDINRQALYSLGQVLMFAAELNCTVDVPLSSSDEEFNPASLELRDGTVVVLHREYLTKHITADGDPAEPLNLKGFSVDTQMEETPPISKPYSHYWKDIQNFDFDSDGSIAHEELAPFNEQGMCYGHFLEWGAIATSTDGARLLRSVSFDNPGPLPNLPGLWLMAHARPRIGEILPIQLGVANRQHYVSKGNGTPHELQRFVYAITSWGGFEAYPVGHKDASGGCYQDYLQKKDGSVLRAITRVVDISGVEMVAPSGGRREKALSLRERANKLAGRLGGLVLPGAQPSPVYN